MCQLWRDHECEQLALLVNSYAHRDNLSNMCSHLFRPRIDFFCICSDPIAKYGTPALKAEFLKEFASGNKLVCKAQVRFVDEEKAILPENMMGNDQENLRRAVLH